MTVTCHYIDQNLQLQNFVLETLTFPERHTGGNIADKLKGVGERWGITHKVIIVSHDQGSNMEAAMEVLTNDCNWQSLPCCAHRLQLCLLAGLKINAIDKLIGAVKKIVSHFSHSVVATEALKNKQQQMNITAKNSSIAVLPGGIPHMKCFSVYSSFVGLSQLCYLMIL